MNIGSNILNLLSASDASSLEGPESILNVSGEAQSESGNDGFLDFLLNSPQPLGDVASLIEENLENSSLAPTTALSEGTLLSQDCAAKSSSLVSAQKMKTATLNTKGETQNSEPAQMSQGSGVTTIGQKEKVDLQSSLLTSRNSRVLLDAAPSEEGAPNLVNKKQKSNQSDLDQLLAQFPILDIVTGKLEHVTPSSVSETIVKSPLVSKLMQSESATSLLSETMSTSDFKSLIQGNASPDSLFKMTEGSDNQSIRDHLLALGLPVDRIESELEQLRANVALGDLESYEKRAQKIQATLGTHTPSMNQDIQNRSDLSSKKADKIDRSQAGSLKAKDQKEAGILAGRSEMNRGPASQPTQQTAGTLGKSGTTLTDQVSQFAQTNNTLASQGEAQQSLASTQSTLMADQANRDEWRIAESEVRFEESELPSSTSSQTRTSSSSLLEKLTGMSVSSVHGSEVNPGGESNQSNDDRDSKDGTSGLEGLFADQTSGREINDGSQNQGLFTENLHSDVQKERHLDQLLEKAAALRNQGSGEVTMKLDSADNGSVNLRLIVEGSNVEVLMRTESAAARDIFATDMSQLRDALAQHDLNLKDFKVEASSSGFGEGSQSDRRGSHFSGNSSYQGQGQTGFQAFDDRSRKDSSKVSENANSSIGHVRSRVGLRRASDALFARQAAAILPRNFGNQNISVMV